MKAIDQKCSKPKDSNIGDRKIWLFDTFTYFPAPPMSETIDGESTHSGTAKDIAIHSITRFLYSKDCMHSVETVKHNFKKFGLLDNNVNFVKGDLNDTIPKVDSNNKIGNIALLRIDNDYYDSILLVLEYLYPKIVKGGYIIVDDYNNPIVGAREAVDDFRIVHDITSPIYNDEEGAIYWQV